MKQHESIMRRLTDAADLSAEAVPHVPLVEIAGDSRVLVENHDGVMEYGTRQIRVRLNYGHLCICGSDMELTRMNREQLIISGYIDSVTLVRRKK